MDDRLHQQALRINEDMALLTFNFLAAIEARRIDPPPPFSTLLTLWLSIIDLLRKSALARAGLA